MSPFTPDLTGARVLLIDDDALIHALVERMLAPLNVTVRSLDSGDAAEQVVTDWQPQVVLLDHEMPGRDGLTVLRALKQAPATRDVPVVMQTGSDRAEVLAECFAEGAQDYIRKPFSSVELRARVRVVLERQQLLRAMSSAARRDRLTGLANRALLHERLETAVARARREAHAQFGLLFLDFDRFKLVNDTLGHDAGDELLRQIADRLRANLRASDIDATSTLGTTVARLGGDEFVVLVAPAPTPAVAESVADRLLRALAPPYTIAGTTVRSTASIGVVHSHGAYASADDMLRDADIAMYEAKARGKGCHVTFTAHMRDAIRERHELEQALRDAVVSSAIGAELVPIHALADGTVAGLAARARWMDADRGPVPAEGFASLAAETRLAATIDRLVLGDALRQLAAARRRGEPVRYVAFTCSADTFADPALPELVQALTASHALTPADVVLQVSEDELRRDDVAARATIARLRERGVRVALTGFGSVGSSLTALQAFGVDALHVDGALIAQAAQDRAFGALLHAVATLAANLGLRLIAAEVSSDAALALVHALGFDEAAGAWLHARLTTDALTAADAA